MTSFFRLLMLFTIQLAFGAQLFAGEKVNQSIDLGGNRQATWYLPDEPADAWILLQHGFQRNKNNLDDIATEFMDNGLMVLTINSSATGGNPSLSRNIADDIVDAMPSPPNGVALPEKLILSGHSAGALMMTITGSRLAERGYGSLAGVILFDPVDASNRMTPAMQATEASGAPVLAILANSSSCNSSNNALQPLRQLSNSFVGIKLTDNSKHTDAEGDSTGGIITFICGSPDDKNVDYVQDFALNWALDMATGGYSADYYPGGAKIQAMIAANDGILVKEISTPPPVANFNFTANELAVQFTSTSSDPDGSVVSFAWDFGDGSSSTQENPSHTYDSAGTYTVTLTVTDDDGQTGNVNKNVTVNDGNSAPNADFTFEANFLDVSFTDTSSDDGSLVQWSWDFGDGSSSTDANPQHTYAAAGSYNVQLTVTDNDGATNSTSQSVQVSGDVDDGLSNGAVINGLSENRNDAVYFTMNVPAGATDLNFAISGGSGDADIYVRYGAVPTTNDWDFRPYRNGNNETVEIAAPQSGVWYLMVRAYRTFSGVTLRASYKDGSSNQAPTAGFSESINGLTANFTDASNDVDGDVVSWLWTFGDGSQSTEANPSHTYATAGDYVVTLAVSDNNDAMDQISKTITVTGEPGNVLVNGQPLTNLSDSRGGQEFYTLNVPANSPNLEFSISGGDGDADIYIRYGDEPTRTRYDYRPYLSGNEESVSIPSPQAGTWHIMIRAYRAYSGVTLTGTYIE